MTNQNLTIAEKQGQELKKLIKEGGYTQEGFAFEYGIDPRTVRKWIKNGIDSVREIMRIAEFFDKEFLDILVKD